MRVKLLFVAALLFTACAPYKIDIRQGNFITPDQREKVKVGMTRTQVRAALGSPLVSDPFHPDRWDYVYSLKQGNKLAASQRMTVYFEGDKLTRIDDAGMPPPAAGGEAQAGGATQPPAAKGGQQP